MYESILRFYFVFGFPSPFFPFFFLFLNKTAIVLKIKYDARQFLQRERQRERLSGRDEEREWGREGGAVGNTVLSACAKECASAECSL